MRILWPNGLTTRPRISSPFGPRNSSTPGASKYHRGCDFVGFSAVKSIADGTVVAVGTPRGWTAGGTQVWVQHSGFLSRSLHLRKGSPVVKVGQRVRAGQTLGVMGNTGVSGGVHLHLEIVHQGVQVDPVPFITDRLAQPAGGGGGAIVPTPDPSPNYPLLEEEDDMSITVIERPGGKEWSLLSPHVGRGLGRMTLTGPNEFRAEKSAGGVVNTYLGVVVTTDKAVADAWGRNYCRAYGNAPSVAVSDEDYKIRQVEASRLAWEQLGHGG